MLLVLPVVAVVPLRTRVSTMDFMDCVEFCRARAAVATLGSLGVGLSSFMAAEGFAIEVEVVANVPRLGEETTEGEFAGFLAKTG